MMRPNLVEHPGIEPGVPEGGGFTVHCITIDASAPNLLNTLSAAFQPMSAQSVY